MYISWSQNIQQLNENILRLLSGYILLNKTSKWTNFIIFPEE